MSTLSLRETKELRILLNQTKALETTIVSALNRPNETEYDNLGKFVSCKQMATMYNDLAKKMENYCRVSSMYNIFELNNIPGIFDMTWIQQKEIMESVLLCTRMLIATIEGNLDFIDDESYNIENFISTKLRSLFRDKPENEKQVQNSLEDLLVGRGLNKGIDYDRETGKFNFSGREYIPDFIINKLNLCIEVKLIKDSSRRSKTIEEINADITAYSKQYNHIIFVVYDIGTIRDELEFKRDIENAQGVKLIIIKH